MSHFMHLGFSFKLIISKQEPELQLGITVEQN